MSGYGAKRPQAATRVLAEDVRARALDLLEAGQALATIARAVGADRKSIRHLRDSSEGRERVQRGLDERAGNTEAQRAARARAHQAICDAIEESVQVLRDELRGPDRAARLRAAESLLDRGGAPKTTKVDATSAEVIRLEWSDGTPADVAPRAPRGDDGAGG